MIRRIFVGSAMLAVSSSLAQRAVVERSGSGKISINLSGFRTGNDSSSRTFLSVLKADLNRSGYFTVKSSGAEYNVAGKAVAGRQLQTQVQVFKVSTRQRALGKNYNAPVKSTRSLAHKVADEITYALTGKRGMASGKIAVVYRKGKIKELVVCDMDGKNPKQVTRDRSIVVGPRWTPDGKNITYTSYKRGYPYVYMTGKSKPLASYGGLNASGAVSPNGKYLAVILSVSGNAELWVKDLRSGKMVRRLSNTRRGIEASPCWSPDGNHIAYVSDSSGRPHIYVISWRGGTPKRISTSGTENVAPNWGKNGYLTWCSRSGGKYRIMVGSPKNRSVRQLETDWADYEDPCWAPDGRHIVCSRTSNYRSAIYLLDTLKDSPVALLAGSGDWYSPACSP
ncbi:MAG: DPP IV N-terminal domain-containing protein [Kiritimatiellaceae bacterium]|nr:DPP IV N-terminal domain-containing protein [Kiritimatiellaceae bacterium]